MTIPLWASKNWDPNNQTWPLYVDELRNNIRDLINVFKTWLKLEECFWSKYDKPYDNPEFDIATKTKITNTRKEVVNNVNQFLNTLDTEVCHQSIMKLRQSHAQLMSELKKHINILLVIMNIPCNTDKTGDISSEKHKKGTKLFRFLDI